MRLPARLHRLIPRIRRCLISAAALTGYLCATIGFPLPQPLLKDRSRPFPCQGHVCGCQTAEQCWEHCCCYSHEEKRAWAEAHHIEPPKAARAETDLGWNVPRLRDREAGSTCKDDRCSGKETRPADKAACCTRSAEPA